MYNFLHHLLVPSHKNNFRARALHLDVLTGILIFFTIVSFTFSRPAVLGIATDITIQRLLDKTNEERRNAGLGALSLNGQLTSAAQGKAQHMFTNNYWDHFAPDGTSPWDFINNSGYKYKFAGENLAYNYMFSDDVVNAWMNSPSHRANILRSEYTEIGFAVQNGNLLGEDTTLVVQMFGTPQQSNPIVPVAQAEEIAQPEQEVQQVNVQPTVAQKIVQKIAPSSIPTTEPTTEPTITTFTQFVQGSLVPPVEAADQSFNINSVAFSSTTVLIGLLLAVLIMDLVIAVRLKLVRVTGKNLAHIVFLIAIFIGVYIIKIGSII